MNQIQNRRSSYNESLQTNNINSKMFLFIAGLVLIFISVQFIKLSTVGRIGNQISSIKSQQKQYELDNELLRAEINKMRTSENISESLFTNTNLVSKQIKVLEYKLDGNTIATN